MEFLKTMHNFEVEVGMTYMSSAEKIWLKQGIEKGIEQGIEKGMEKGIEKGINQIIIKLLESKFGYLSSTVKIKLQLASTIELETYGERILFANSVEEVLQS